MVFGKEGCEMRRPAPRGRERSKSSVSEGSPRG